MEQTGRVWLAGPLVATACLIGCRSPASTTTATSVGIRYIDATDGPMGNTRLAKRRGQFTGRGSPLIGNDNLWSKRPEGNGGSVFTTNDGRPSGPEDGPQLVTIVTGLVPGEHYRVYAYFWTDQHDWRLKASLAEMQTPGEDLAVSFGKMGSPTTILASLANVNDFDGPPMLSESNRQLLQAELGEAVAVINGRIQVWIDDKPNTESSHRTWYDGVGVAQILPAPLLPTLPKTWLWLVLAALAIGAAILYLAISLIVNRRTSGGEPSATEAVGSTKQ